MSMRQFLVGTAVYLAFWIALMAVVGAQLRTETPSSSTPRVINQR